jgi:hypothetical protein
MKSFSSQASNSRFNGTATMRVIPDLSFIVTDWYPADITVIALIIRY